jgi:hypothetical protein
MLPASLSYCGNLVRPCGAGPLGAGSVAPPNNRVKLSRCSFRSSLRFSLTHKRAAYP